MEINRAMGLTAPGATVCRRQAGPIVARRDYDCWYRTTLPVEQIGLDDTRGLVLPFGARRIQPASAP